MFNKKNGVNKMQTQQQVIKDLETKTSQYQKQNENEYRQNKQNINND